MIRQWASAVPRRYRPDDDSGSMAVYLMLAIMGMALGALIVPLVITSSQTTRSDTSRVHALDAAQAGLNVMLGQIRSSVDGGVGTSNKLPCNSTSGLVNGVGPASYTVSIAYYMADPVTSDVAPMRCVPLTSGALYGGPYDPVSDSFTPRYARITSVGKDGPPAQGSTQGRTLEATYVFRTTNTNIIGGRIRIYPASSTSPELCMDTGQTAPAAGAPVLLQACASALPPKDQQIFAYRPDLTLQLLSSITGTYPNGLCLDTAQPPAAGQAIFMGACQPLGTPPPYSQQWSFNDNGGYTAALQTSAANGGLSSVCLSAANQSAGVPLTLANCSAGGTSSPTQAWIPFPAVGPGAAQAPQLVNFSEFGRCLDVTNQNVNSDHLIDFPCKQNPYPGAVAWNQKFTLPNLATGAASATGPIYTTVSGTNYCLTSPGTNGGRVTVTVCSSTNARQRWTVNTGDSSLTYAVKFTIVDSSTPGLCLGLTEPAGSEVWSSIDVETCKGLPEQKWNASANELNSVLQDIDEIATPG
jgi:hypothetical protein